MKPKHFALGALLACAPAVHADVTVNTSTSGKASILNVGGDGVNLIKGRRMRTDSMVGNRAVSLIMDIDNLRFVE
ncbi:MAG TPA: hypothetical protein VFP37_03860, partial [Steroidobacteraceae bacterium]|nr:hypothetical protein [Steroidobacteraceae bacterium]